MTGARWQQRSAWVATTVSIHRVLEGEYDLMATENSFDVVSQYDEQELVNALDQTRREVNTRFDLKDTKTEITQDKKGITILTASEFTLKSVMDVLQGKMVKRNLSLKILKPGKVEQAHGMMVRQTFELQQGISQELAKDISKLIRDRFPKVKAQIQGDAVRVSAKSRDDLQAVIAALKEKDYPVPLQFDNYR
jgi:cyclic-di-GMP-binding protein